MIRGANIRGMLAHKMYDLEVVHNPEVLKCEACATIGITIHGQYIHQTTGTIIKHPVVYSTSISLGRSYIIIDFRFESTDLLNQFLTEDLFLSLGIKYTETFIHNKPRKYHNVIWLHRRGRINWDDCRHSVKYSFLKQCGESCPYLKNSGYVWQSNELQDMSLNNLEWSVAGSSRNPILYTRNTFVKNTRTILTSCGKNLLGKRGLNEHN